jgi:hypothetical protein
MRLLFTLLLLSLILTQGGCQTLSKYMVPSATKKVLNGGQEQLHKLFIRGMQYQKLDVQQQHVLCEQLKQEYQINPHWQIAWLMAYSLNKNYSCVDQNYTLDLLNIIQTTPEVGAELLWLNKNQIQLHNQIHQNKKLQTKLDKSQKKNKNLKSLLVKKKEEVQEVNSKIQALKEIETKINKKLDDEETIGQ